MLAQAESRVKEQEEAEDLARVPLSCLLQLSNGMNEEGSGNN